MTACLVMLSCRQGFAAQQTHAAQAVTFAYFPLAVPVSVLGETIRRDRILERNLKQMGIQLTFQPFARGNETMELIRANKIDAVAFGDMPTIEACVVGRMQIVGLAKHGYSAIVGPKGLQIRDLRKKRIGNATASTGHHALLQALAGAGINENDVTIVPMNLHEMQPALADGRIDAFAAWEPIPTATLQAYPNRFAILHRQVSLVYFLVSDQLVVKAPGAAKELTAALIRATRWLKKSNRHLTIAATWARNGMASFSGRPAEISTEEIIRITRSELLDIPGVPQLPLSETSGETLLAKEFSFMKRLGKLPANASWERVNLSFHRELMVDLLKHQSEYALNRFEYAH